MCEETLLCGTRLGISDAYDGGLPGTGPSTTSPTFHPLEPFSSHQRAPRCCKPVILGGWLVGFSDLLDVYLHPTATLHIPSKPPPHRPSCRGPSHICLIHSSPCLGLSSPYLPCSTVALSPWETSDPGQCPWTQGTSHLHAVTGAPFPTSAVLRRKLRLP